MKKLILLILVSLLCVSCGAGELLSTSDGLLSVSEGNVIFTDDRGMRFSLPQNPTKTAVLFSSFAELWRDAGGRISVTVGESIARGFAAETTPTVDSGAGKRINAEILVSHMPDLVIGSVDIAAHTEAAALLGDAGIPCALFRMEDFADYLRVFEIFCALCANPDAYTAAALTQKAEIDALLAAVPSEHAAPRILFLRAGTGAHTTKAKRAEDHFAAEMLAALGCENIADTAPALLDGLSMEYILSENPDAIFISLMGDAAAARAYMEAQLLEASWQTLDAVQNDRVYFLPKDLFQFKPNGRYAAAYRMLYTLLYPEVS